MDIATTSMITINTETATAFFGVVWSTFFIILFLINIFWPVGHKDLELK